MDINSC